jgi:DNA-binding transcriptional MocR family regulator
MVARSSFSWYKPDVVIQGTAEPSMLKGLSLTPDGAPLYQQLADAIAARIESGALAAGERLPGQRDIAQELGINVTTVTRAFAQLQRRGLVESRPGRGTVVNSIAAPDSSFRSAPSDDSSLIDLSVNRPATSAYVDALAELLPRLPRDTRFASLKDYQPPEGPAWARAAAAAWMESLGLRAEPSRVLLTEGAQHGLACILAAIARPGDLILADVITYQGISALCRTMSLELRGLPVDREGVRPSDLDTACARWRPRALFLVPCLHNPTTTTIPAARRGEIVEVARRHNLLIIEDDVYRPLLEQAPPAFTALEPELTFHVTGFSKCVSPGLRMGYVLAPRALANDVAAAIRINCWSTGPLAALVATVMVEEGAVNAVIERQKEELRRRQAALAELLADFDVQTSETSTHAWLNLPEPWRPNSFARRCLQRGVAVLPAEAFIVGRDITPPHAVRINVSAARSLEDLRKALGILAGILSSGHLHLHDVA